MSRADKDHPRLDRVDMKSHRYADKESYQRELAALQQTVMHVQQAYWHAKKRAIIVFEGWDAAGKGGAIRRLTETMDPRGAHVWPIAAPLPQEQGRHYLWRFWQRLPEPGTFAIFDRSWYGRVMVERVEGFAKPAEWRRAYREINEFERMLTDDGVRIVKLFLHISDEEQKERFHERLHNPYKRWKLTEEDLRNRAKRPAYEEAINEMFAHTSPPSAPWHLIPADAKWYARVEVLRHIVERLSEDMDISPPPLDHDFMRAAEKLLG
ncbi:polyphosphate kinase 2 family protein [Niveispirillum irakense]|uniref:polyphosphate kinase 2 family protein n=1 Tax=Niveispirillum irakense TaxID=34011 RepID=UPI00041F50B1|nr:polyphosphate kinase [Niveispirillum irakense]